MYDPVIGNDFDQRGKGRYLYLVGFLVGRVGRDRDNIDIVGFFFQAEDGIRVLVRSRGLGELKRRVDSGEMRWALALYPVSMKQIMDIADSGNIMPPKATWFEPKLRSGLVIHKLETED